MSESKYFFNVLDKVNTKKEKKLKRGKKKESNKEFSRYVKLEKGELKNVLRNELSKYYKEVISKDGFLYAKGNEIVLTAHMDTTPSLEYGNRKMVKKIYEYKENGKPIVDSPQGIGGDDRCGIYMIMQIVKTTDLRPTIVFCEDEEIGCIGSSKFSKTDLVSKPKELKYLFVIVKFLRKISALPSSPAQ